MKFKRDCPLNVFKAHWDWRDYEAMSSDSYHIVFCAIGAVMYSNRVGYDHACSKGVVFW